RGGGSLLPPAAQRPVCGTLRNCGHGGLASLFATGRARKRQRRAGPSPAAGKEGLRAPVDLGRPFDAPFGPDLDAGEPGFPGGKLAILRDGLGPPNCDAGLTGACTSPASAWPGVDVKMPIGIVFQAADSSVPAEEG